ncbi:hypothetical protein ACU8V6_00360 [Vibrio alginolyticus]
MLPRHPNYLWTQLAEPRLAAGVIADGHHLPDATLATMIAAKRDHGLFLVSDAVATPAALRDGGLSTVGGGVQLAEDGALRHVSTGFLAGSVQTLRRGCRNRRARDRVAGHGDTTRECGTGSVLADGPHWATGARADVLLFDWASGDARISPREVRIAGEIIETTTGAHVTAGGTA